MENLSFVEIKSQKVEQQKYDNSRPKLSIPYKYGFVTSLVTCVDSDVKVKTEVYDVTDKISTGKYDLSSKFTILYLYDYYSDKESKDFLSVYGGKLHNQSSFNVAILTYLSQNIANGWTNVFFRDIIEYNSQSDAFKVLKMMKEMQDLYGVNDLPAMVVIKKDDDGKEEHCKVELAGQKKDEIYNSVKSVIDIINDNCEEDFAVITNKICGPDVKSNQCNNMGDFNTYCYIQNLVKKKSKELKSAKLTYNFDNLAGELSISPKTLYNKRSQNSFTRDECIYMAIKFEISVQDLNKLLTVNNHSTLGLEGRDGIIVRCLANHLGVNKTDEQLSKNGYAKISKF